MRDLIILYPRNSPRSALFVVLSAELAGELSFVGVELFI